ncbi:LacI family DNA-binding transcriptional regulator [Kushneria marisflavi]|uniref:LacI family transcriptional regulator n=1 Tax=Kushneria marisflavi TaxID=157779 RepID=A0A240UN00_9GAMM|nr:LacI family DNA-binding transcriptional regulator [Kushneria marisflavi]ART62864.1 LacI family transcriptional regulator [Kushneria marisflavi]RKD84922.1 LacI family transcriptional regulator [Kushneria marisflavi]
MSVSRKVTIADIARHVGMTNITVSRALNKPEMVRPATRERIEQAALALGYVPNAFARGLKRSDSRLIGVVTASLDNPFYAEMIKAISRHAKQHDYAIMLFDTDGDAHLESMAIDSLLSYQAAGIILSPVSDEPDYRPDYLTRLRASDIAVVQLDRTLYDSGFSAVVLDNLWAGERVARYLLTHAFTPERHTGDDRLLVVAGPEHSRISQERLQGVRDVLSAQADHLTIDVLWGDYTLAPAVTQVRDYLKRHGVPRAIFGLNQLITLGSLKALQEAGIAREQTRVIGIDRLPYLDIFDITVPCVVHDGYRAGAQALEQLLIQMRDPQAEPNTLTVRGELVT